MRGGGERARENQGTNDRITISEEKTERKNKPGDSREFRLIAEDRRSTMQREQEEQNLVKMREWENELINDDQQWDEKHREVELQKEENHTKVKQSENELCKEEGQKKVKQRTHEIDTWMNMFLIPSND